ncbi:hypothetical protein [Kribbella voronezhensis]|nr:hypothetical protein [Kribbella voronezhensis]
MAGGVGLAGLFGTPGVIAATHPILAAGLFIAELTLIYVLVMSFLYGSKERGERVFRLLRWVKDKEEPSSSVEPSDSGPPGGPLR